jgi:hypothetical protein
MAAAGLGAVALAALVSVGGSSIAAHATDYPATDPAVAPAAVIYVGDSVPLLFEGFQPGEPITAVAPDLVGLAAIRSAVSLTKPADGIGSVVFYATSPVIGTYLINVTGASGRTVVGTLLVLPLDAGPQSGAEGMIANTGFSASLSLAWGAAGALVLGAAAFLTFRSVRRHRA